MAKSNANTRESKTTVPGIYRYGVNKDCYLIRKAIEGRKFCKRLGKISFNEAKRFLAQEEDRIRKGVIFGDRETLTVDDLILYFKEWGKKSVAGIEPKTYRTYLRILQDNVSPYFGEHEALIAPSYVEDFIEYRRDQGVRTVTINHDLQALGRIINLAATRWRDPDTRLTLLPYAPKVLRAKAMTTSNATKRIEKSDKKKAFIIPKDKEDEFIEALPKHLQPMALFVLNTGLRQDAICNLRWDMEQNVEDFDETVFRLEENMKNKKEFFLVLNSTARAILENQRGNGSEYVFTYKGNRLNMMGSRGWYRGWRKAGFPGGEDYDKGPHNLRRTFASRLRALGVPQTDISDLLHHIPKTVTEVYTVATLRVLREAVELLVEKPKLRRVG